VWFVPAERPIWAPLARWADILLERVERERERERATVRWNRSLCGTLRSKQGENGMAKKQTTRGRKQDRARVAGGQDYEVRYEAKKTGKSRAAVKKAVKKVGSSRRRVERRLGR
jgi:hypothetical protein